MRTKGDPDIKSPGHKITPFGSYAEIFRDPDIVFHSVVPIVMARVISGNIRVPKYFA